MARKGALNYVLCNFLALALTVLLVVAVAEGKGGGKNSSPTSSASSSSPSLSSSGSKSKTKKVKDKNSKITRCYNEQMVEIPCPVTKNGKIAGYVVGGIFGIILLFVLYTKIKAKIVGRREDPEANNRDLEEDGKSQQMSDHEKGGAGKDSDSSDVPLQHTEKAADEPNELNPPGSTITPPIISMPVPEHAQPNHSPKPPMTTNTTAEPLPMPATTPTRKDTLADKFKNALKKARRTATT